MMVSAELLLLLHNHWMLIKNVRENNCWKEVYYKVVEWFLRQCLSVENTLSVGAAADESSRFTRFRKAAISGDICTYLIRRWQIIQTLTGNAQLGCVLTTILIFDPTWFAFTVEHNSILKMESSILYEYNMNISYRKSSI